MREAQVEMKKLVAVLISFSVVHTCSHTCVYSWEQWSDRVPNSSSSSTLTPTSQLPGALREELVSTQDESVSKCSGSGCILPGNVVGTEQNQGGPCRA